MITTLPARLAFISLLSGSVIAAGTAPPALPPEAISLATQRPTVTSEHRLNDIVLSLMDQPADAHLREWLTGLATREPAILMPHPEGAAWLPLVDVGASARAVLARWARDEAITEADRAQKQGAGLVQQFFTSDATQRAGVLDYISSSAPAELTPYRDAAAQRIAEPGGDALASALALRLGDVELMKRVVAAGSAAVVQSLLVAAEQRLQPPRLLPLFESALQRPELASMALFQLGRLSLPEARERVWRSLHDPALGATAATILSLDADRHTIARLSGVAQHDPDPLTRQRAALALSLRGTR